MTRGSYAAKMEEEEGNSRQEDHFGGDAIDVNCCTSYRQSLPTQLSHATVFGSIPMWPLLVGPDFGGSGEGQGTVWMMK